MNFADNWRGGRGDQFGRRVGGQRDAGGWRRERAGGADPQRTAVAAVLHRAERVCKQPQRALVLLLDAERVRRHAALPADHQAAVSGARHQPRRPDPHFGQDPAAPPPLGLQPGAGRRGIRAQSPPHRLPSTHKTRQDQHPGRNEGAARADANHFRGAARRRKIQGARLAALHQRAAAQPPHRGRQTRSHRRVDTLTPVLCDFWIIFVSHKEWSAPAQQTD